MSAKDSLKVNGVFQERNDEGRLGTLEGAVKCVCGGGVVILGEARGVCVRSEAREQLEDHV